MEVILWDLMEEELETPTTGATTEEAVTTVAILATGAGTQREVCGRERRDGEKRGSGAGLRQSALISEMEVIGG
ncbi:hypothetical protein R1flu_025852 [Riccia fluitans]|uniref:Uncharacterized protein n=1 Tax=Riccia fluitans TaxID=41844 RepID=A0ABD1XYX2_9MARC